HHLAGLRVAAVHGHAPADVVTILACRLDTAALHHDGVGMPSRESTTGRRHAGLADDRSALRAGRHVEGPARAEILAGVVDGVNLADIGEHAALLVGDHRTGLP